MAVFRIDRSSASFAISDALKGRVRAILNVQPRSRRASARLIYIIEAALVIAIGLVLGLNSWLSFGPVELPPQPPAPIAPTVEAVAARPSNPFRSTQATPIAVSADPGEAVAETTLSLTLHGTWVNDAGGVAIIQTADQKQDRFVPGDVISDGVTLESVLLDQVILLRNGTRESLRLINRESRTVAALSPAAPPTDGLGAIGDAVIARPQPDSVGNLGLVLQPAGDIEEFDALGLEPGDRLVAVDNQPVGTDIASALGALAMTRGAPSVTISIERKGVVMPVTIPLTDGADASNE